MALTIAVSLLFAVTGPTLGRRLPPALATRVLVAGSLAVGVSTIFVLAVVAFTWVGQLPEIAALGPWSRVALRGADPIPDTAAIGSAVLLLLLAAQASWWIVRRCRALLAVQRSCRYLPHSKVPGRRRHRPGRCLHHPPAPWPHRGHHRTSASPAARRTSSGPGARDFPPRPPPRVVGARRQACRCRQPAAEPYRPALWPMPWSAGPTKMPPTPSLTAPWPPAPLPALHLLMRQRPSANPETALGVLTADVPARVQALLAPPPRLQPAAVAALITLALTCPLGAAAVQHCGERLFDHAAAGSRVTVSTAARRALDDPGSRFLPHITGALVAERV